MARHKPVSAIAGLTDQQALDEAAARGAIGRPRPSRRISRPAWYNIKHMFEIAGYVNPPSTASKTSRLPNKPAVRPAPAGPVHRRLAQTW